MSVLACSACTRSPEGLSPRGGEEAMRDVPAHTTEDHVPAQGTGVAVVELFTSEGCSSCPPADGVLSELAAAGEARVIPLSFHVDYWDSLGWPDPFATAESTARQEEYARRAGARGLYTPQMVVGGRSVFVGSERSRALLAVHEELERPARARLVVTARRENDNVTFGYAVEGTAPGDRLTVALVLDEAEVKVPRGENAGKKLRHARVVRAFADTDVGHRATGDVSLAADDRATRWVAYVRDGSLGVVGASTGALVRLSSPRARGTSLS
jgi:hypothetical protein